MGDHQTLARVPLFEGLTHEQLASIWNAGSLVKYAEGDKTPTLSLREVQQKIFEKFGRDVRGEKDTNPEDEKQICEIIFGL